MDTGSLGRMGAGRRSRRGAARLCALIVFAAILTAAGANPAAATALSCEVSASSVGTMITWSGTTADTERLIIERRVGSTWHWRGAVDPALLRFEDDATAAEYRIVARGSWPTVVGQADCTDLNAPSEPFSCEVSADTAGYLIEWPAVDNAEYIVRRQVFDKGIYWWRGRVSDTSFVDGPSPTGEAFYQVEVISGSSRRSADCFLKVAPVPDCGVTTIQPSVRNAEFDQPVVVGGDGAAYFSGSPDLGLYRVAPNAVTADRLPVPGTPDSISDLVAGPNGDVYFFGTVSGSNRLYRVNVDTGEVEQRSLAPGYGWSYQSDKLLGSDGRIYWAARFGDSPSQDYGLLVHDPATNRTERVLEGLDGRIDQLLSAPGRIYFSWAPNLGFDSINGDVLGPREVRYVDLATGTVETPATPADVWRFPQYSLVGLDGRLYISPGVDGGYDPVTDSTFSVPSLGFDPIVGDDGRIYSRLDQMLQQFDPATGEIRRFDPPASVFRWNPFNPAFVDGAVYAINNIGSEQGLFKLDLATGVTVQVTPLTSRITPSIGGGGDGRVYFFASVNDGPFGLQVVDASCP